MNLLPWLTCGHWCWSQYEYASSSISHTIYLACHLDSQTLMFPMAAYDAQQYVAREQDEINQVWITKPHSDRKSPSANNLLTEEMQQCTLAARRSLHRYPSTKAKQYPLEHNSSMQKLHTSMLVMSFGPAHLWKYRLPKYGVNYSRKRTYCRIL